MPLALSFFVITIVSTVLSVLFSDVYYNENLYTKMRTVEERKIAPMLKMTKELLYKAIQNKIDMLNILMDEFNKAENGNSGASNTDNNEVRCDTGNVINIIDLDFTNSDNYEDKATWFISPTITSVPTNSCSLIMKYNRLIKYMKQFYQSKSEKPEYSFELFYIVNRKEDIVMTYPIKVNNTNFYSAFTENGISNPIYCRNSSGENPNYLYFACRIWYIQFTNSLSINPSRSILISTPYEMKNEHIDNSNMKRIIKGITICKKDSTCEGSVDDCSLFCVDILYDSIVTMLDNLNRRIPGYFFVMPTNIDIPIYYPNINSDDYYLTDITRFEFPLNQDHFINEVSDYKHNVIKSIIAEYDSDASTDKASNTSSNIFIPKKFYDAVQHTFAYTKGNALFEYNIFPVVFFDNSNQAVNLLNIVYVVNKDEGDDPKDYCGLNIYYVAVLFCCHVIIVGCTLLAFFTEIITNIGKNLIYQINDFKKKINQNSDKDIKTTNNAQTAAVTTKQGGALTPTKQQQHPINNIMPDKRGIGSLTHIDISSYSSLISSSLNEDESDVSFSSKDDEEETLALRDKELKSKIDPFFVIKRIYPFLNKSLLTTNDNAFSELIQAREVFRKMGNAFGVSICQSNLGNHFNLLCKYDKAIPFFLSSLNISLADNECDCAVIYDQIETIINTHDIKTLKYYQRQPTTISNANNNSTSNNNCVGAVSNASSSSSATASPIIFSRFIKLFHAYKMFFSSMKHRAHYLDAIYNDTKSTHSPLYTETKKRIMYSSDYFGEKTTHRHDAYYKCISICINRCLTTNDISKKEEKVAYGLLELLHYEINALKHKAKTSIKSLLSIPSTDSNDDECDDFIINNSSALKDVDVKAEEHRAKKELKHFLVSILKITKALTIILDQLQHSFENNKQTQYKTFLYELKHSMQNENEIELNYLLLNQRFGYLKAKLAKFCGDYAKAVEHYVQLINEELLILNGVLYQKANQKIINILSYANDPRVNDVLQFKDIKDKETGERLISECTCNLQKLIQKQKDYVLIIDISCYNSEQRKLQAMQIKTMRNVFENYIAENDKISIYIFSSRKEHLHKIFPLVPKNAVTYGLINSFFDNLNNNMLVDGFRERTGSDDNDAYADMKMKYAIDAVFKAVNELPDKRDTEREQVLFIFTESFQSAENRKVNKEMLGEFFKDRNRRFEKPRLFIVGNLMADQDKLNYARDMFRNYFDLATYFEYENYQEIKKMLTTIGRFPRGYEYQNETFDK